MTEDEMLKVGEVIADKIRTWEDLDDGSEKPFPDLEVFWDYIILELVEHKRVSGILGVKVDIDYMEAIVRALWVDAAADGFEVWQDRWKSPSLTV